MAERIIPADAETAAVTHLAAVLDVAVSGWARGAPEGRRVQVRGTGGNVRDVAVGRHQLTVTAWGESPDDELEASRLATSALSWVKDAEQSGLGSVPCSSVAVLSLPYADPDPTTGRARYSFTVLVDLRGTAA